MPRLAHNMKYFGTFVTKKGVESKAYMLWNAERNGFVLYSAASNKPLIPGVYSNYAELRIVAEFNTNGATAPVEIEQREAVAA